MNPEEIKDETIATDLPIAEVDNVVDLTGEVEGVEVIADEVVEEVIGQ